MIEWFNNAWDWLSQNYGLLAFLAVIALFLSADKLKKVFKKKPAKTRQVYNVFSDGMEPTNAMDTFTDQKDLAQQWLEYIEAKGKGVALEEQELMEVFNKKKAELIATKKLLGMRYTAWSTQLSMINNMIKNQERFEEEYKQIR